MPSPQLSRLDPNELQSRGVTPFIVTHLWALYVFIVKSESKRSPRTDFAVEDMKENIRVILIYIGANYRIARKRLEISNKNKIFIPSLACRSLHVILL